MEYGGKYSSCSAATGATPEATCTTPFETSEPGAARTTQSVPTRRKTKLKAM